MWQYKLRFLLGEAILCLLIACPSPLNPARQAIDATAQKPATPPAASASTATATPTAVTWTCPMHPEITQDHAGTCPKCMMDLVRSSG